ncbi:hypothetical protein [Flavisolibacter tropicus]|uniref:Uncharacterized protein n=1 Tax=Flavisolibacter tropicus TaxID=1492898 RepID=A0A172TWZ5_9BACT|nr:hypothetical protein [Flavisolibacter tropicus]ANE51502.1 hypothetical protein SY85_14305 [Flavisolibacter tropicus]
MAKQVGPIFATGTIDGIIFYKLGDKYYMRSKGDYKSAKMMRKDPKLKRTMEKADQFRAAVKLLKPVYYRQLPKGVRKYGLFGKLTGMVNRWLQEGKSHEEVKETLITYCQSLAQPAPVKAAPAVKATKATPSAKATAAMPAVTTAPPEVAAPATQAVTSAEEKTQQTTQPIRVKQARYLSRWKVKRNGQLHIPHTTNGWPSGITLATHPPTPEGSGTAPTRERILCAVSQNDLDDQPPG